MAIDFPANPSVNDTYTFSGRTWKWNGEGWPLISNVYTMPDGTASSPGLAFTNDVNTGLYSPGADTLAVSTSSTERIRITSSGEVLIGATASADFDATLQVRNDVDNDCLELFTSTNDDTGAILFITKSRGTATSPTEVLSGDELGRVAFRGYDGASYRYGGTISCEADGSWTDSGDTTDNPGRLVFYTTPNGESGPVERMRITSDGYLRMAASTGGIQFNGDTAAANALDDYEVGTWTAVIAGTTAAGTATYGVQVAHYAKVGDLVSVQGSLTWSAGTGTGNLQITELPFTVREGWSPAVCTFYVSNVALTAGNILQGSALQNTTSINIDQYPTGGGASTAVPYDAAGTLSFSAVYRTT